jgi:N-acyl-D-aspartate/D-glutamate deacylase
MGLMEGVEQIPATTLAAGIPWAWETFPEYLDFLASRPIAIDIGVHVPHGPLRVFVMGERGASDEPATDGDIETMARLVAEAMDAGALGFSSNRFIGHTGSDGVPVPGTFAAEAELLAIGRALAGRGVFLVVPNWAGGVGDLVQGTDRDFDWMCSLAAETGQTMMYPLIDIGQGHWRYAFEKAVKAWDAGLPVRTMTGPRAISSMSSLETQNAFSATPTYQRLSGLPLADKVARMRESTVREAILAEDRSGPPADPRHATLDRFFAWGDAPTHALAAKESIAARATREGRDPKAVLYDCLLQDEGHEIILMAGDPECHHVILGHESSAVGLSDGGAHVSSICDQSTPTVMLSYGLADASGTSLYSLEWAVWKLTGDPASMYGLDDRGVLEPGRKADLNIIDRDRLKLRRPDVLFDMPGGNAPRLSQRADGYVATMVSGTFVARDDEYTGELPGTLVGRVRQTA